MRARNLAIASWLERGLWAFGICGALWLGGDWLASTSAHARLSDRLAAAPRLAVPPPSRLTTGDPIGVLEIPRLKFSEPVAEGDDEKTLSASVGHLPDTPLPWGSGNSVFAGHRDRHFRALRAIRVDDEIRLRTPHGTFTYRVVDKMIVEPADVWVLDASKRRRLTLVTCYPFSWTGHAPQRFVVKAEETVRGPKS